MTDRQQTTFLIDRYVDLLRVKKAGKEAWEDEIDTQLSQAVAQLEALGVVVEKIEVK